MEKHKMMSDEMEKAFDAFVHALAQEQERTEKIITDFNSDKNFFEKDDYMNYRAEIAELMHQHLESFSTWSWNYEDCI